MRVIGTCGVCGGMVAVPICFWCIYPPQPRCLDCGRVPVSWGLPELAMQPAPHEPLATTWQRKQSYWRPGVVHAEAAHKRRTP